MKEGFTELVFILDRSGSMEGLEADTIGGFNAMMAKQKKEEGEACVTTVLFDDRYELLHDRIPLAQVPAMTEENYYVRGCTALLDAIGETVKHISTIQQYAREEDKPEKTLFVITTDGMENTSRHYGYEEIKKLVRKKEKEGWEFLFIGANIDSIAAAGRVGIREEHAVNYIHDGRGTASVYASVGNAVHALRRAKRGKARKALQDCDWAREIRQDYEERESVVNK